MRIKTVDTRHGSYNQREFSNGNTLPYTGAPFGMNYFVLQNSTGSNWFFNPNLPIFQGIRLSHQPSPWMGDYSALLMTPVTGRPLSKHIEANQTSYSVNDAVFAPHYLRANLLRYRLLMELTPTTYGAKLRLTNRSQAELGLQLQSISDEALAFKVLAEEKQLHLTLDQAVNDGKSTLKLYVVLAFDQSIDQLSFNQETQTVQFNSDQSRVVELAVATSFISHDQAQLNLESDQLTSSFDDVREQTAQAWERHLALVEVEDRDQAKVQAFDQYLYRLFLFPQTFYERDAQNQPIHFDVYAEEVKPGKFFTNNGYWDTYKTVYPFFSLLLPDLYQEMLEGIQHFYLESGHLPKWLSPDERGLMPGTLVNAVIADAAVKGLLTEADLRFFLEAMVKEARTPPAEKKFGRAGVTDMLTYGYVTNQEIESVNQTLDNAYSDFCIRQLALLLGEDQLAEEFAEAALNYRHLFDAESGFMRGKNAQGEFTPNFRAEDWHFDYTEGSAWQNSLAVFHNFQDYLEMMGGREQFLDHLIRLANEDPIYDIGNYGMEIHEMSEYATSGFSQITVSNQPSFHLPYLFTYAGKPAYTQLIVKQMCEQAFSTGFDGFPGDEDNGSMSGWFVFSQLGFYPVTPGVPEYVLGIPQFDRSRLNLPNGQTFTIETSNHAIQNNFIQKVELNQEAYTKLFITHETILAGGQLQVKLSLLPSERNYSLAELPYSLTKETP